MKFSWKAVLSLSLVLLTGALVACVSQSPGASAQQKTVTSFVPGTYEGVGEGNNGPIRVKVTVSKSKILSVEVVSQGETAAIAEGPLTLIPREIVEQQSLAIDAVSGATHVSEGILSAVEEALKAAGANLAVLKTPQVVIASSSGPKDLEADVVIVGGGGAGLAAAIEATNAGATVIVLEKTALLGGNTLVNGGIYNCPDPELQEPAGIVDSVPLFIKQTYEGGDKLADLKLVTTLCENSYAGLQWLKKLGVQFQNKISQGPGSLYPRTHDTVNGTGADLIKAYVATLKTKGAQCQILLNTPGTSLVEDQGRVVGVKAQDRSGAPFTIRAKKGVILATGGFAGNVEMRVKYCQGEKWPDLGPSLKTSNMAGISGDGIRMAEAVGANLVDMDQIQLLHMCSPKNGSTDGNTIKCKSVTDIIFVNKQGNRFVREDGRRDEISKATLQQTGGVMYAIESSDGNPGTYDELLTHDGRTYTKAIADGDLISAPTVAALAQKIGAVPANLQAALDEYNANVEAKAKQDSLGRTTFVHKIITGPFLATPRCPAAHHTMGGVQIDVKCHVLRPDGTIIPGLFAAGEVTGDIHGGNRLGGNAVVDTVVFGRIAGTSAAE